MTIGDYFVISLPFSAYQVSKQQEFVFAYSAGGEGFAVMEYLLGDFVGAAAEFLCFFIELNGLGVVVVYPLYVAGVEVVLVVGLWHCVQALVVGACLLVLAGEE